MKRRAVPSLPRQAIEREVRASATANRPGVLDGARVRDDVRQQERRRGEDHRVGEIRSASSSSRATRVASRRSFDTTAGSAGANVVGELRDESFGDPAVALRPRQRTLFVVRARREVVDARPRRCLRSPARRSRRDRRSRHTSAGPARRAGAASSQSRHRQAVQRRIAPHAVCHRDRELAARPMLGDHCRRTG